MLKGPMEYIPPVEVEVVASRKAIPLHQNEGIYVRNTKSGAVRAVIGQTYMLGEDEELWEKQMAPIVRTLLDKNRDATADRGEYVNPNKQRKRNQEDASIGNNNGRSIYHELRMSCSSPEYNPTSPPPRQRVVDPYSKAYFQFVIFIKK